MESYDKNIKQALQSITPFIEETMKEFREKIDDMIMKLNDDIELEKKKIKDTIKKSVENYDKIQIQNKNDFNYSEINNTFLETLYNNLGLVNTAVAGGIGAGIMIGILGFGIIPGVGTAISVVGALSMVIIGFIIGPSREKKFIKSIEKIKNNIADGFDDHEWNFNRALKRLKKI